MLASKMFKRFIILVGLVSFSGTLNPLKAQFKSIKTEDLHLIYYDFGHEMLLGHTIRSFTKALQFHQEKFDYEHSEPATVIIQDFGDFGNAGASAVPQNVILMSIAPFSYAFEKNPANERINVLMNHELVHIAAQDNISSTDRFFRSLFMGKVDPVQADPVSMIYGYLTTPRRYSPRWYHEGIAEFMTTWMSGGIGRVMGAYDEMVFRTMVRDSAYIYDAVGLESEGTTIDFEVGSQSYMYGTRFMSYLAQKHGAESLLEWTSRTDDTKRYYANQFKNVYGVSLDEEWSNWIEWEKSWQKKNLARIHENPVTEGQPLTKEPLGGVSNAIYDEENDRIFVAVAKPGDVSHITILDPKDGSEERLVDIKSPALHFVSSLAYDSESSTLFYTDDNNKWRDLYSVNVETGENKRLIKDSRTGDLTFNPSDSSLIGVRHYNGISSLVKIPPPYDEWNLIHSMPYGNDIFDIDISPDGKWMSAALADVSGNQRLVMMRMDSLIEGKFNPKEIFDFQVSSPSDFTFSKDGNYLYGSTYYSGVSNIVRYDISNEEINWLTNAESGYFRPVPVWKDSLLAYEYTGDGFLPTKLADEPVNNISAIQFLGQKVVENQPEVKEWILDPPSPKSVNTDSLITDRSDYSYTGNLSLSSAYPIVQGYKNFVAGGYRADFHDNMRLHHLGITASVSPHPSLDQSEYFHASLNYDIPSWRFFATYNRANFYDLFGPTKTSRKGYSIGAGYDKNLINDTPKQMDMNLTLAYYGGLERLPQFQNVITSFENFVSLSTRLSYSSTLFSLGAVDHEKGFQWELMSTSNYGERTLFPRINQNLDYGFELPLPHSSLWLRSSTGYSFSPKREPLGNFYFGGFGNNWIDHQTSRRYREYYSFPGTDINQINGTNYGKLTAEWTTPPMRFKRFGFLNLYANWAQINLFTSGILTNVDDPSLRQAYYNVGAQLDIKMVMFSILETTLSVGHASAWNYYTDDYSNEWMISLKIL